MRCLWLTRLLPAPPFHGGDAVYSAGLISALAKGGTSVTVLCHDNGGQSEPPEEPGVTWMTVPPFRKRAVGSLLSRLPSIAYRSSSPQFSRALSNELNSDGWDAIVVDNLAVAAAALNLPKSAPLVYLSHNHEESVRRLLARVGPRLSPRRLALEVDAHKARDLERRIVRRANLVTAVTAEDVERFKQAAPTQRYLVLTPGYAGRHIPARRIDRSTPRRVLVLGTYSWVAKQVNLKAFLDVAAQSLARAEIGIDVVGAMPQALVLALKRKYPEVTITGAVDAIEPYLDRARVGIVAEGIGGGFKLKVLDYVFNRLPVAALAGAVAGTPLARGSSLLEFTNLSSMVDGLIGSIDDFDRLNSLQEAAFAACEGLFEWNDRGQTLVMGLSPKTHALAGNGNLPEQK